MLFSKGLKGLFENEADVKIQQQKEEIKSQLEPVLKEFLDIRALKRTTTAWYSQNTSNMVYEEVANGKAFTRGAIEAGIEENPKDINENDGSMFVCRLNDILSSKPDISLKARFKRNTDEVKNTFLETIKEQGETLLSDVRESIITAKENLEAIRQEQWAQLETVRDFYETLTETIIAEDKGRLVNLLQSDNAQSIPADWRKELLLKPVSDHGSVMLAIANMGSSTPVEEAEVIAKILNTLENDYQAFLLMQQAIDVLDGETKDTYLAYLGSFLGTFIPIEGDVLNVNQIGKAYYQNGYLYLSGMRIGSREYRVSREEADSVIKALVDRPNYISVEGEALNVNQIGKAYYQNGYLYLSGMRSGSREHRVSREEADSVIKALGDRPNYISVKGEALNVNQIGKAWYQNGSLKLKSMNGYGRSLDMSEGDAAAIIKELGDRPNYISVEGEALNVNQIGKAWYQNGSLNLKSMNGYGRSLDMSEEEAATIIKELGDRPNYISVEGEALNVNQIGKAYYQKGCLYLQSLNGYGRSFDISEEEAATIIKELGDRPNYILVEDEALNINQIGKAYYQNGYLYLKSSFSGGREKTVDEDNAKNVLKSIRQAGQRMAIMAGYGAQRDQLSYALNETRLWEKEQSLSRDSETFMNYMPLIITAYVLLSDNRPEVLEQGHEVVETHDQGDVGITDDFADVNGLDAVAGELSVLDRFDQDFSEMTSMMDDPATMMDDPATGGMDTNDLMGASGGGIETLTVDTGSSMDGFDM